MVSKIGKTFLGKGLSDEVLNSFGVSIAENFLQEAIMDPLQELNATMFGGKEAANWDNIWARSLESGIDGIISAIILSGASVGIASAENVANKVNPTSEEYNQAFVDTVNSGKVDVKGIIEGGQEAIILNQNMERFYTATYNQDGNVENVEAVQGKTIDNPNKKVNVNPVIIKNRQNDYYNVIDSNTGLLLDSTPYQSLIEAQANFDNKMINLDNASINNVNDRIAKANIAISQAMNEVVLQAESEMNADRNVTNDTQTPSKNVTETPESGTNNVNTYTNVDTNTTNMSDRNFENVANKNILPYQKEHTEVQPEIQEMANRFIEDLANSTEGKRYKAGDSWTGQKRNTTRELAYIKDNTGASWSQIGQALEDITNNKGNYALAKKIEIVLDDALTNGYRNIYGQNIMPNDNYISKKSNYESIQQSNNSSDDFKLDDYRVFGEKTPRKRNTTQASQNEFTSVSNSNTVNYISQNESANVGQNNSSNLLDEDVRNIVKYNQDGREISDENYVDFLVERYKDDKNISGVITDTRYVESIENKIKKDKISDLYEKIKDKEFKITKELRNENGELQNVDLDLAITKTGLNESFNKGFSNEKYAVVPYLDELIKTAPDGTIRSETKQRENILEWYYLYNTAEINGELYGVKIDVKKTGQGDRFYVHRVNLIKKEGSSNLMRTPLEMEKSLNTLPSTNTSISQNKQSVKNSTNVTNKSMRKNENNATRSEKIGSTAKYNNYTQKEIDNLKSPKIKIANSENDVLSFIESAKKMPSNLKLYFGKITKSVANRIKNNLGIDVSNYNISLRANTINHILKKHGNIDSEALRGQVAINEQDLALIPEIINNYDNIVSSGLSEQDKPSITFEKNINGTTVVVTYVSDKHNNLEVQTMYKFKNKKGASATGTNASNALVTTSKTNSGTNTPSKSIPQNNQNVKDSEIRAERTSNKLKVKPYNSNDIKRFLTGNNLIEGVNGDLKSFVTQFYDSLTKKAKKKTGIKTKETKMFIGRINDNISNKINNLLNNSNRFEKSFDTTDTNIVISSNNIEHIYNQHGNETRNGQIDVTPERLSKYGEVVSNPDYIGLSSQLSRGNTPTIYFTKKINGYSIAVAVLSSRKQLYPESYYVFKSNSQEYQDFIKNNNLIKIETEDVKSNGIQPLDNNVQDDTSVVSSTIIQQNSTNVKDNGIRAEKTSNTQNKTLLAQHNTSEEKLLEALNLGALPVPSIAITKYQNPVLKYGDITLLFSKDTINPTDRRNVTYNSDIYSTRKPEIGIALDKQKLKSFEKIATEKGVGYGYLGMIEEYIEQNEFSRARELIQYELEKANNTVNVQDVEDIYTKLLESVKEKRIMKPGVDPYTPSGNRKSLIQMSIPYTLDNIVKTMTQKSTKGSESNSFKGLAEIRANLAQNFNSIDAMHQSENNLITNEEMENLKQELNDKFYELVDEIAKHDKVNRYFGSTEVVANALNETAKAKNLNTTTLDNELAYVDIKNVPEKTLQKAIDFLNSMKNIPTEYFESKPQRAVGFEEVQKAIVPQNTSKEVIDKLKSKGIPIEYYSTNEQRKKLISKNKNIRFESTRNNSSQPYDARKEQNQDFLNYLRDNNYLKTLFEVDNSQGETYAHSPERLIEQEIRKLEETNGFDNSIPVTKLTDIDREIENYLGKTIGKGHFRERARGIYNQKYDTISVKEYKDLDNVFHELGHALDLGGRIKVDKSSLSDELLAAVKRHGGYENETIGVQLDEGFAEILKTYAINKDIVKQDYPKSFKVLEDFKNSNVEFGKFISKMQQETYNYIHQSPQNRVLSNQSIGEQTDKAPITVDSIKRNAVKLIWDSNYSIKEMANEFSKTSGRNVEASKNVYLLTRLASGVDNKAISMISDGYIDLNGKRVMPGLNKLGEILGNNPQRWNDLRAYLVAQRDLEYKAKSLKTGVRTMDSKAVVQQFYNDTQIREAAKVVYDTLDGVLQYAIDNGLMNEETAQALRESNAFYVPFQRVIQGRGNQIGRRGAVSNIINKRTGSELDIKDVLENIVTNSVNIIQQVENNNILKTLAEQGEEAGMNNNIFQEIPAPMKKIGTAQLQIWENELKRQGIDTSNLDLEKTIDIFVPNNNITTEKDGSHIVSFFDQDGNRKYLQFYKESTDIFNALMGLDKNANSKILKLMRAANMPLRYGATMANVGFAIPNMISDTVQATIYSEAGFIPVIDNILGVLDVLGATNKTVRNFLNQVAPEYAKRISRIYNIYQQTGASSSTRMSQYRKSTQEIMRDIYGTKNSETLGIKESFKPLKRLMDLLTYIPELSESSTRFRVFERNYEAYKNKGNSELDARIKAAIESRDATQDFGRTGTLMHEVNQLIPFSAARVGSAYTFAERVKANPKRTAARVAILVTVAMAIKALGYDDDEIEELNQRKKDDNFVLKVGDTVITIKKPQGILRSIVNLAEYVQDLATGHIEEGKEGERLGEWLNNAIMDNMPADEPGGLVPNALAPIIENFVNKDFYYNNDIVKSWDLDLPDSQQYYDYTSQLAIWLGQIFNYSPAKIDNLISGYFGGLGTQLTNTIDWISGKIGLSAEKPAMGAEDNAIGKRFIVNVNENSASVDEIYDREEELTKKQNGGTITEEEVQELESIKDGISKLSALNKQIKAIKQDLTMSGEEKAEQIRPLQEQKVDVARQALGKEPIYTENTDDLEALEFYPSRSTLSYNGYTLELTEDMKQEYEKIAYDLYKQYEKQGLYSKDYLDKLKSKCKDAAKKQMIQKYRNKLTK